MNESIIPVETFTQFQKSYSQTINLMYDIQNCLNEDVADIKIHYGLSSGCRCASCSSYFVTLYYSFLNNKRAPGINEPQFYEGEVVGEDDDLGPAFYDAIEQIKRIKEKYS